MGEDVYTWIVGLAREYGREWANFNAPEDMWKWMAERVEGRLAGAWDEGYEAGVGDESAFEHGAFQPETANPYRSEGDSSDPAQAEVPGREQGEEDPV